MVQLSQFDNLNSYAAQHIFFCFFFLSCQLLTFPELMEFSIIGGGGPLKFLHWAFLSMFVKLSRLEEGKKKKKATLKIYKPANSRC